MQDPREPASEEIPNRKLSKKKISSQKVAALQLQGNDIKEIQNELRALPLGVGQKTSQRNLKNEVSPLNPTTSENEYRALRRKYLLLEEESSALEKELREVDNEVKTLEDDKLTLLDQLVVLEGLVDTSEMQPQQGTQYD